MHDRGVARDQPREPARDAARRLCPQHLREHRQPLAHRGGLVVDDVVDARSAVLERQHGRRRGVVQVDEGEDAAPVADDRELPLADRLDQPVVRGAVEAAVAQGDAAGGGDRLVEVASSRRPTRASSGGGFGSSGSSSVLTGPPCGGSGAREALRDEPADAAPRAPPPAARRCPPYAAGWSARSVRSKLREKRTSASAVAWCEIASGPASSTTWRTARDRAGRAGPAVRRAPAHVRRRRGAVGTDHLVPCSMSCETRREPSAPLAPATKTRIVCSFRVTSPASTRVYLV